MPIPIRLVMLMVLGIATADPCFAANTNDTGVIAILSSCSLDSSVSASVAKHVEMWTGAEVRVGECISTKAPGIDPFARDVRSALRPMDRLTIVLHQRGTDDTDHTILTVNVENQPFAMLNVQTLLRDSRKQSPADKKIVRRIEKEALRAVSVLAGRPPCSVNVCAAQAHRSIISLDTKSYNYCPPCRLEMEDLLRQRGMHVKTQIEQEREARAKQPER